MNRTGYINAGAGKFPSTRWSLVLEIQKGPDAQRALGELCEIYWYPIYAFIRRSGHSPADSEDATQGFVAHLLGRGHLGGIAPEQGKLRSYLLSSVKNFLKDERVRAQAQKRGGGRALLSIDADEAEQRYRVEPADLASPDLLFEKRWALTVLERAMKSLGREYAKRGQMKRFTVLKPFLPRRSTRQRYVDAAQELEMTAGAVQVAVHRLRERYRNCLCDEIAHTVSSEAEIEAEIDHLFSVFG